MKKVLLFSRDPGGSNVILPLVNKLQKKYEVSLYGKDAALLKYKNSGCCYYDLSQECSKITLEHILQFLEKHKPNIVLTGTSADDNTEKYLWEACKKLDIPCAAILDQWVNYGIRFSKYSVKDIEVYLQNMVHDYLPSVIFVMDEYAKQKMTEERIPPEIIKVTGQPHFDSIEKDCLLADRKDADNYINKINKDRAVLLVFASEPICKIYEAVDKNDSCWGYTEKSIFQELMKAVGTVSRNLNQNIKVIIRPHPKENVAEWEEQMKNYGSEACIIDHTTSAKIIIQAADIICGMSSMFLTEALLCKKKVISIQIGLKRENPFIWDQKGILPSVLEQETLCQKLEQMISDNSAKELDLKLKKNAVNNILEEMERML